MEIACHGSQYVQQAIVRALIDAGCALAEPGEFTKRAFLNGKLDLTEAEADMIIAWLQQNHKLIVTVGSVAQNIFDPAAYPNLMMVLADYGLTVKEGILIDNERNGGRNNPFLIFAVKNEETDSLPSIGENDSVAVNLASGIFQ